MHAGVLALKARILSIVPRQFFPHLRGGLEITADVTARVLADAGYDVAVAAREGGTEFNLFLNRILRRLVRRYPRRRLQAGYEAHYDCWHPADLTALIDRLNPAALVCHTSRCDALIEGLMTTGLPTLYYHHDAHVDSALVRAAKIPGTVIAAESTFLCQRIGQLCGQPAVLLRPLIEPDCYKVPHGGASILVVNPHPLKGGELVVEIARRLPQRHFLVVGGWSSASGHVQMQNIERDLKLLPNVERLPQVADMRTVLVRARCLLMPCLVEEAFARSAAEACIAGIPIVASDRGALPETAGIGGIFLDPCASPEKWVDAVEQLFTNDELHAEMSARALRQANETDRRPEIVRTNLTGLLARLVGESTQG